MSNNIAAIFSIHKGLGWNVFDVILSEKLLGCPLARCSMWFSLTANRVYVYCPESYDVAEKKFHATKTCFFEYKLECERGKTPQEIMAAYGYRLIHSSKEL
jgi:hypothetical protein